jgi:hypothetical protein
VYIDDISEVYPAIPEKKEQDSDPDALLEFRSLFGTV